MNASFKKRLMAYLFDIILVILIVSLISVFIPTNDNLTNLSKELIELQTTYANKEITLGNYLSATSEVIKDIDQYQVIYYVLLTLVLIIHFVIWPVYHQGQTIGKKKMHIRIVKDDLKEVTINDLLIRNMIINNIGCLLIQLLILFILPSESYYLTLSFLSFVQMIIVVVSIIMVIKRKDKHGIHDLITKTKVIEVEK